jgi:hypothetical protein
MKADEIHSTYQEGFRYLFWRFGKPHEALMLRVTEQAYKVRWERHSPDEWHEQAEFETEFHLIESLGADEAYLPQGFAALYRAVLAEYGEKLSPDVLDAMPEPMAKAMKAAGAFFPKTLPDA